MLQRSCAPQTSQNDIISERIETPLKEANCIQEELSHEV
jgi:hypothetical protein